MANSIGLGVDARAWNAALDVWVQLSHREGTRASHDAADAVGKRTAQLASIFTHPKGTKTPSPPGSPVGRISGDLVRSIWVEDIGDMTSLVGPTIRYARVQELGGPTHGWWPGSLPERPYLKPATRMLIASGRILRIYYYHWAVAQAEATGS